MDRFRIKIRDKATGTIIYDNQLGAEDNSDPSTAIGGITSLSTNQEFLRFISNGDNGRVACAKSLGIPIYSL